MPDLRGPMRALRAQLTLTVSHRRVARHGPRNGILFSAPGDDECELTQYN